MYGRHFINDYTLQALADGELSREEASRIKAYLDKVPEARERYEAICAQKTLLRRWWENRFLP